VRPPSDRQLLHRQYLQSPIWKEKRKKAIEFYGTICARCSRYGTDVHHKTYDRVGGDEQMEDLEVLCRECHEAHHRAERATKSCQKKTRSIHRRAIFQYLTITQKDKLIKDFGCSSYGDLAYKILHSDRHQLILAAVKILGFDKFHGNPKPKSKNGWVDRVNEPEDTRTWDEKVPWMSLDQFKQKF